MFDSLNEKSFIIGTKQVKNAIKSGKASKIYIALDCDPEISEPVKQLAQTYNLTVSFIETRKELGQMCGIDVKTACAAQTL